MKEFMNGILGFLFPDRKYEYHSFLFGTNYYFSDETWFMVLSTGIWAIGKISLIFESGGGLDIS